jgi:hypothetical protein
MASSKPQAKPRSRGLAKPTKPAPNEVAKRDAAIKLAWEGTTQTIDDIAAEHGLSKGRISQMAKAGGWTRGDLTPRVRAKAQAKVDATLAHAKAGEDAVIEAAAEQHARIILAERRDVDAWRGYVQGLWTELLASAVPAKGKGKAAKDAPAPLPLLARIDGARKLVAMGTSLLEVERRVHNIVDDTPVDPSKRVEEAIDNGLAGLKAKFNAVLAQ